MPDTREAAWDGEGQPVIAVFDLVASIATSYPPEAFDVRSAPIVLKKSLYILRVRWSKLVRLPSAAER